MKNIFIIISFAILIIGCGSDDSDSPNPGALEVIAEAVDLTSPAKDSKCNVGVFVSSTESTVQFSWTAGKNADSYDIVLTNLKNNTSATLSTSKTELDIKLLQDTEYSWHVVSKSNKNNKTSNSETWKMENTKLGEQNHAPFPSDITNPKANLVINGVSTSLDWIGNDKDNDIESYDIYLDTTNPPTTKLGSTTKGVMTHASGTLTANTKYFWFVISKDTYGNSTKSSIVSFTTGS